MNPILGSSYAYDALGNLTQVQESDPALGAVVTNYSYDVLNHLVTVSMPRGGTTQTRTFNYGNPPGVYLLSVTNPESGTVRYAYNSDGTLATKTDGKGQVLTYAYDGYKRVTQVSVANPNGPPFPDTVLRTYSYDTNPYDGSYSQYANGRLTAVQYNGLNGDVFTDMFSYAQPGGMAGKRLRVTRSANTGGYTLNADLGISYTYNPEGRVQSVTYPTTYDSNPNPIPGATYTYSFDMLGRMNGLTDQNNTPVVSGVSYGPANELRQMTFQPAPFTNVTESRGYNTLLQMTSLTSNGSNIQYSYPAGANNGKISSQTVSGEQVVYTYDSLNRLSSASGNGWGTQYSYDGFGNLVSKTPTSGSAPSLSVNVDGNNRVTTLSYDGNGNVVYQPGMTGTYSYDAENRMVGAPGVQYGYDGQNKRNYKAVSDSNGNVSSYEYYFYGADGQKIGTYYLQTIRPSGSAIPTLTFTNVSPWTGAVAAPAVYFGGRRLQVQDRLGSVGSYYPYGEDKGAGNPGNDNVKFATYTRDGATGLDYADQRYYSSGLGRFMSPDPYQASGGPGDPGSWNRYAYTRGDPVNRFDPLGLQDEQPSPCQQNPRSCLPNPPPPTQLPPCPYPVFDITGCDPSQWPPITPPPPDTATKPFGTAGIPEKLGDPKCAKAIGANSPEEARKKWLDATVILAFAGPVVLTPDLHILSGVASASQELNTININQAAWIDPEHAPGFIFETQKYVTVNLLSGVRAQFNNDSITVSQYYLFVTLHELSHLFSEPDSVERNLAIARDCLGIAK